MADIITIDATNARYTYAGEGPDTAYVHFLGRGNHVFRMTADAGPVYVYTHKGGDTKMIAKNATADVTFYLASGNNSDTLKGGSGDDLFSIEGRDFITGGGGRDDFVVGPSYRGDLRSIIYDYTKWDTILIDDDGPRQDITIEQRKGDTVIFIEERGHDGRAQDTLRLVDYTGKVDLEWGF